jgi:hypothetical protein
MIGKVIAVAGIIVLASAIGLAHTPVDNRFLMNATSPSFSQLR